LFLSDVGNTGANGHSVITLGDGVFRQLIPPGADGYCPQLFESSGPKTAPQRMQKLKQRIESEWNKKS